MLRFLATRLARALLTIAMVVTFAFVVLRLSGDPALLIMSLWLLPRVKGALVGLQWALRMHGFDGKQPTVQIDGSSH